MVILIFSHELHWRLDFITVSGMEMTWRGDFMDFFFLREVVQKFHCL